MWGVIAMGGGGQQNVKGKLSIHLFELLLGGTIFGGRGVLVEKFVSQSFSLF